MDGDFQIRRVPVSNFDQSFQAFEILPHSFFHYVDFYIDKKLWKVLRLVSFILPIASRWSWAHLVGTKAKVRIIRMDLDYNLEIREIMPGRLVFRAQIAEVVEKEEVVKMAEVITTD